MSSRHKIKDDSLANALSYEPDDNTINLIIKDGSLYSQSILYNQRHVA